MPARSRFRRTGAILLLLLLPACAFLAEYLTGTLRGHRASEVAEERCAANVLRARQGFESMEQALRAAGLRAVADSGVVAFLTGVQPDRAALFESLGSLAEGTETGLEVYDRYGGCAAWTGRSGPNHPREIQHALAGKPSIGVERTPLFAELYCVLPVTAGPSPVGVVIARRILGLNYPFTNRILTRTGIDEQLSARIGATVEFRFAGDQEPWSLTRKHTAPLYGTDSVVVGQVGVACPDGETIADETHEEFRLINALAILPALIAGSLIGWRQICRLPSPLARTLLLSGLIWGVRFLLLVAGITETIAPAWMQDRSVYGTPAFWGLAASPAELLLTALAFHLNVLIPAGWIHVGSRSSPPGRALAAAVIGSLVLVVGCPPLVGVITRSIVMDSTANFSDPAALLPSCGSMLLILAGLLFGIAMLALVSAAFQRLLSAVRPDAQLGAWISTTILSAAVAEGISAVLSPGLVPPAVAATVFLGGGALGALRDLWHPGRPAQATILLVSVLMSGVLLHLSISPAAQEKDRGRVEGMAGEVLRPVDSWFRGVVADALRGFSTDAVLGVLDQGDPEETRRIAFTVWAHSLACREGYASVFAVTDAAGRTISRFSIGGQTFRISEEELPSLPGATVGVHEVGNGAGSVRMYTGVVPLRDAAGNTLGFGRVLVAAARQTLFRGETPAILRSTSREGMESFHRKVALAEYRDGVLVPSEGTPLPLGSTMRADVRSRLDSTRTGIWVRERLDGRSVETYYVRGEEERTRVVALSMKRPGLQWNVAALLRILAGCAVLLLLAGALFAAQFLLAGGRPILRFRHRLLGAFLLLSVLPMVGMVLYAQWFARERLVEQTSRALSSDTRDIVERVAPLLGGSIDRRPSVDRDVERIATDRNTDFNLYLGEELLSSSAPTLYEAGILDRRLSAEAYTAVVLGGRPFVMLTERIGEYRFAVGYRALVDSVGTVLAVIAAPTVFRQDELDSEIAGTTTFIAGLAIVVLLFVIIAATAIARTIAAPIQDLTEATARVARGDLDAIVRPGRTGGEIGVLVRSFERMTHELKTSRDALIRYERELAWKDMAKQVAHEINNPLTPMKLLLQHLGRAYRDGAEDFGPLLERVLRTVIGQIDQLGRIAAEFSHFARMPKRVIEPSDLRHIVDEVVELYSKEPRVRFLISIEPGLPAVPVDRDELHRAIINVIRNGVQAMNGEGTIEIRAALKGAGIALEIQDHGPGMPEDVRARAFEAGFTTKKGGSGVGLGLVKSAMDVLGGTVTLTSTPGEGTTVTLWIPEKPPEQEGTGGAG